MPGTDMKRVNYFLGQFLEAQDFLDEQRYHVELRRRRNRLQYGPGILDGLAVTKTGAAADHASAPAPPWTRTDESWSSWFRRSSQM